MTGAVDGLTEPGLVHSLLERCDFPPPGEPGVLAVSGGPDSMALLVLAAAAGLQLTVVHVDHGLRDGSAGEAGVVAEVAKRYRAEFELKAVRVEAGGDLEARARAARYSVLPAGVMTGHTMDDQAETILLNLIRGAGIDGLAGMRTGPTRRPLLRLRNADTEALCEAEGIQPVRDPTNQDLRFRRNRVRSELIPLLCDIAGRDVVPVLARQAELLSDEAEVLDQLAAALDASDARTLRDAPPAIARRSLRLWLRSPERGGDAEAHPPSAAEIARVLEVAGGLVTACELAGGRRVSRTAGRLRIHPGSSAEDR